ncbi:hypothetical protein LP417_06295 [Polaromonas sp. P1-6]|nr:hypothetical protein LP417_06295 [Polaromonas sp. P1-6]
MTDKTIRLGRYCIDGRTLIGRADGEFVDIVSENDDLPGTLTSPASAGPALRRVPVSATTILPPLAPAARVFAIAINYPAHGVEAKFPPPVRPLIFYKAPSNFIGHGGTLNPEQRSDQPVRLRGRDRRRDRKGL